MTQKLQRVLVAAAIVSGIASFASANDDQDACGAGTLRGTYVFTATGHNVVAGVAQPKAIIEVIEFNGDGTLLVLGTTRSLNGAIGRNSGATGGYVLDASCFGTLSFDAGPKFDIFVSARGERAWMIQTDPNTVFQGSVARVSRSVSSDPDRER